MSGRAVVLTGGVGGSKLVDGLARAMAPGNVSAIVNTGDDFIHLGLRISPDVDTLLYTLSGLAHPLQGWGREDESWHFMETLNSLGGPQWFRLGDRDLALHVLRTQALNTGARLSAVIGQFARSWGIETTILPMTDDQVSTIVETDEGLLSFQRYFVERRCEPRVRSIRFEGALAATPAPGVLEAVSDSSTIAVFIAPSNPFLSVDPILAVPGIRDALAAASAPVIAVSPLVGGKAVKGPTTKIMDELGLPVSVTAIVRHYAGLLDAILVDKHDSVEPIDIPVLRADTLMTGPQDRVRVARAALELAERMG